MTERRVRFQEGALEQIVSTLPGESGIQWGEPDEEGFYTPAIWWTMKEPSGREAVANYVAVWVVLAALVLTAILCLVPR